MSVTKRGKNYSVTAPGQKNPTRLPEGYTEQELRERIASGEPRKAPVYNAFAPKLMIDIETAIKARGAFAEGKSGGFERWASKFNLKEAANTLVYLKQSGINTYEELAERANSASKNYRATLNRIKEIDARQAEINELQKQIANYTRSSDMYTQYRKSGWSRKFYDEHSAEIELHRAAKRHFDALGMERKLPKIAELRQEWAALDAEKKKIYSTYRGSKDEM